jgi:hypothetical protein
MRLVGLSHLRALSTIARTYERGGNASAFNALRNYREREAMSDQVKLLYQARTMRNVARQSRSVAQQLSEASYRQFVLR